MGFGLGEFEAFGGLLDGLDDVAWFGGEGAGAGKVHAGELEAVEDGVGSSGFEHVDGEGVDDHGEGHLDGEAVFDGAEFDAASFAVVGTSVSGELVDVVALGEALVEETEVLA
jgi:hypothetical protein